jgi:predicted ABC-type sugar transport system permease subunit
MKLSLKAMIIAGALFKAVVFLFISLMNLILRPYGGAYLAILSSLYPGYDPVSVPIALVVGTLYSLLAGALAGLLFGCLYNFFAEHNLH